MHEEVDWYRLSLR